MKSKIKCKHCKEHSSVYEPYYCMNCKKPILIEKAMFTFTHLTNFLENNGRIGAKKRIKKELGVRENQFNKGNYIDFTVEELTSREIKRLDFKTEKERQEFYEFEKDLKLLRSEFQLEKFDNHILLALR